MRKFLTIGELADILSINASTIRHYEREGLIKPSKIEKNGYRLYDFDKLDRMENLILLKDLDIPLKDLKDLVDNYSLEKYNSILNSSLSNINSKIEELEYKKNAVNKKLQHIKGIEVAKPKFNLIERKERRLSKLHSGDFLSVSIKDFYEIMKKHTWFDYLSMEESYMQPLPNNNFNYFILEDLFEEAKDHCPSFTLKEGKYLIYDFFIEIDNNLIQSDEIIVAEDKFIEEKVKEFDSYIKENSYQTAGPVFFKQMTKSSNFALYSFHMTIEVLIEN